MTYLNEKHKKTEKIIHLMITSIIPIVTDI